MEKSLKISAFQYDVSHDLEENFRQIEKALTTHADLLVLPELSLCGYLFPNREALCSVAEPVPGPSVSRMQKLSEQHGTAILFGMAEREGTEVFNTAVLVDRGRYVGKYRKIHLSNLEKTLFSRGTEIPVFSICGHTLGVQICFDLWFPEISRAQRKAGAELLCVLGNFGGETTFTIAGTRAIENLTPLVLCNRVGEEQLPDLDADFLGKSTILSPDGTHLATAKPHTPDQITTVLSLSYRNENIICKDFDSEIAFHEKNPEKEPGVKKFTPGIFYSSTK